jgi:hypothetical protein
VATVVAGGTASRITGGKFGNGALTAAYGYIFNACMSGRACLEEAAEGFVKAWQYVGEKWIGASATFFGIATAAPAGAAAEGVAVLGHFPAYVRLADSLSAETFNVGAKWTAMSTGERWAANKAFLDNGIERGVTFVLATDIRAGMSYFRAEVQYLLRNGYEYGTLNGMKALVKAP